MKQRLAEIARWINERCGRDISVYDESFLEKSLEKRQAATTQPSLAAYVDFLFHNDVEADTFLRSLTITYSEFFRNTLAFALLEGLIFPRLIADNYKNERGEIRIWSAGCAAGQEAYSIAILLDDLFTLNGVSLSYRIFATDISLVDLETAQAGVYPAAAVQNVRLKHLCRYFTQNGETYTVSEKLRQQVDFSVYDLLDTYAVSPPVSIYGDFDLVIGSNLLFYYRSEIRQTILGKFYRSLSPYGYLVTGEAEKGIIEKMNTFRVVAPPASVFQKTFRRID